MQFEVGSRVRLSSNTIAVEGSPFANAGIKVGSEGTVTFNGGELPALGRAILSAGLQLELPEDTEMTYVEFDGIENPNYIGTAAEGRVGWAVPSFELELLAAQVAA